MKRILSGILFLAIIFQATVNVGIAAYYHVNKSYISNKLCENRNNPRLHCNGHCYLSKQLKKAQEGENRSAKFIKEKEDIVPLRTDLECEVALFYRVAGYFEEKAERYASSFASTHFKPPAGFIFPAA